MFIKVFRYLNRSFALALVIFASLGYLLSRLFPTTIVVWDTIFILAFPLALSLIFLFERKFLSESSANFSIPVLIIASLPLLIFVPVFVYLLQSPTAQVSNHGELHGAYIEQLLLGVGQPDNPYVLSASPNYPWLFHAVIAVISHLSQLPHPFARIFFNIILFASSIAWIHETLIFVSPKRFSPLTSNLIAIFVLCGLNLFGFLHSMVDLWDNFNIWNIFSLISPESFVEPLRLHALVGRYFSYTSTSLGFLFAWVCIYAALNFVKNKDLSRSLGWFLIGLGGGIAFLLAGGFLIPLILGAGAILFQGFFALFNREVFKSYLSVFSKIQLSFPLIVFIFLLPILVYFLSLRVNAASSIKFSLLNFNNFTMVFGSFYPLLPFLGIALIVTWIEKKPVNVYLLAVSFVALCLALFVDITTEPDDGNEYKFTLFSTFLLTLTTISVIDRLQFEVSDNLGKKTVVTLTRPLIVILFICVALNTFGITAKISSNQEAGESYYYEGTRILSTSNPYQGVFTWLRQETNPETVLLMLPDDSYRAMLFSGRQPYVTSSHYGLGESSPNYTVYLEDISRIFSEEPGSTVWLQNMEAIRTNSEGRPLALIAPQTSALYSANMEDFDFYLAYTDENAKIYLDSREN